MGAKKRNGFYYFALDFKKEHKLFHTPLRDIMNLASQQWNALPMDRKDYYKEIAKSKRGTEQTTRYNSYHEPVDHIIEQESKKLTQEDAMRSNINDTIRSMSIEDLKKYKFYFVHVNYYCKTTSDKYKPAELGIVEFSLLDGALQKYHTIFAPPNEIGYAYEIKKQSERHKIPYDFEHGVKDCKKITGDIVEIFYNDVERSFPVFYTMPNNEGNNHNLFAVMDTFKELFRSWSSGRYEDEFLDHFTIYPLDYLFFVLKNYTSEYASGMDYFSSWPMAQQELRNRLITTGADACEYHLEVDAAFVCSLSYVINWAFVVCDYCCKDVGVTELKPGKHRAPIPGNKYDKPEKVPLIRTLPEDFENEQEFQPHVESVVRRSDNPRNSTYRTNDDDHNSDATNYSNNYRDDAVTFPSAQRWGQGYATVTQYSSDDFLSSSSGRGRSKDSAQEGRGNSRKRTYIQGNRDYQAGSSKEPRNLSSVSSPLHRLKEEPTYQDDQERSLTPHQNASCSSFSLSPPLCQPKQEQEPVDHSSSVSSPFRRPKEDPRDEYDQARSLTPPQNVTSCLSLSRQPKQEQEPVDHSSSVSSPFRRPKEEPRDEYDQARSLTPPQNVTSCLSLSRQPKQEQ